jgi:hypothetical protein
MLKKWLMLLLTGGFLSMVMVSEAGYLPPPGEPFFPSDNAFNPNAPVVKPVGYFNDLVIIGNIDVDIKTNASSSQVVLTGDKESIQNIKITEQNDTLTIDAGSSFFSFGKQPVKVHADVYTKYLNDLTLKHYQGRLVATNLNAPYLTLNLDNDGQVSLSGNIGLNQLLISGNGATKIQGITGSGLVIRMKDSPSVDLSGMADIDSIEASGGGRLRLYWVDSNNIQIKQSGTTSIELAGVANHMMLRLEDSAHFDGRYLRTILGYAKTYDNSVADVQFLKSQAVLASDDSTISFYGKPPYKANFMGWNGADLDMNDH